MFDPGHRRNMARKKTLRLAELADMAHVFIWPRIGWESALVEFVGGHRLVLDIGCGTGDTTVALAAADPSRLYLGVDLKGARLHRGAEAARRAGLTNVAFTVAPVRVLSEILPKATCEEGWLFFPDPFLKRRAVKHRLTAPAHLAGYRGLFREGARIHLRTDSRTLFEYSRRTLEAAGFSLCRAETSVPPYTLAEAHPAIHSRYELRYRSEGRTLHFIEFQVR